MEFQCGCFLEFQLVVIIFITLNQPLYPKIFSEQLRRPVLVGSIYKRRPILGGHKSKRRPILIVVSNRRPFCSAVFKEMTEEEEHVSFNLVVVLLENLEVSMILTDEDQPLFMESLDSRTSLSQLGDNDANRGD